MIVFIIRTVGYCLESCEVCTIRKKTDVMRIWNCYKWPHQRVWNATPRLLKPAWIVKPAVDQGLMMLARSRASSHPIITSHDTSITPRRGAVYTETGEVAVYRLGISYCTFVVSRPRLIQAVHHGKWPPYWHPRRIRHNLQAIRGWNNHHYKQPLHHSTQPIIAG